MKEPQKKWANVLRLTQASIFALIFSFTLSAQETTEIQRSYEIDSEALRIYPLTLEHANTDEKRIWGLMGRPHLPKDHGMLFYLAQPGRSGLWMFNCQIDLSVGFLDQNGILRDTHELKAFPEKMDPARPVRSLDDLALYPASDPIRRFFRSKGIKAPSYTFYMLEMNKNWFAANGVYPGDILCWTEEKASAYFIRPLDLTSYIAVLPAVFTLPNEKLCYLSSIQSSLPLSIAFLDSQALLLEVQDFTYKKRRFSEQNPVIKSKKPVKYLLVADKNWFEKHHLKLNHKVSFPKK